MNREPIYYINEEKGIVVCEITDCYYDAIELVQQKSEILDEICSFCVPNELAISDSFKGIAKTHEGDTFDIEFGKKLAFKKAIVKRNIAISKKVNFIVKSYKKGLGNVLERLDKIAVLADDRVKKCSNGLEELFNEVR